MCLIVYQKHNMGKIYANMEYYKMGYVDLYHKYLHAHIVALSLCQSLLLIHTSAAGYGSPLNRAENIS